ncbi:quinone oxidoreductase [Anaerolineales bacterium HSG25]|nr:quinone oxidoreductase [Anaerolineales bacterium HSG25]
MKAVRVQETGGPEVLTYMDVPTPDPQEGQILIKIAAAGLNFIDTYHRTGLYPMPLPFTLGVEGAGVVEEVGEDVSGFKVGDKVAYIGYPGADAEYVAVPADKVVPVPSGVSLNVATAAMIQGMTAHYLVHSTYPVQHGETILVHAAAGGTGLLLVQMAKRLGATVIGTVSTEEKAQLARDAGADHIILYTEADFEAETKKLTDDKGVQVVYDSVGQTTFDKSLNVLRPLGYMVLFGQSSGMVPPFDIARLAGGGSLFLTRPSLFAYIAERNDLLWRAKDVFDWIKSGKLNIRIDREVPLANVAEAHNALECRQTSGKVLLIP